MLRTLILPSWYPNLMKPDFAPYVRAQAESMSRCGIDVTVLYTAPYSLKWILLTRKILIGRREKTNELLREIVCYVPKTHIKPLDTFIRNVLGKHEIRRLERRGVSFELIHVHTYEAAQLGKWYSRRSRIPMVITEHYTGFARGILGKREMRTAIKGFHDADVRLAVSQPFADLLFRLTNTCFEVLPNFIDTTFFSPDKNGAVFEYDFLAVGHLLPKKNHRLLIESFSCLAPLKHDYHLALVGEGISRIDLEKTTRALGLEKNVHLLGFQNSIGVRDALRRSRIYCMPSLFETFGIAVIEAMAVGLPAVVTSSGGPETIVEHGETGFIAESTVQGYSNALQAALDWEWNRDAIRQRTIELYSEQTVMLRLQSIYSEAIRQHIML